MTWNKIPRESILQSKILKDLRSIGKDCICFKIEKASENGIPDIFFSTPLSGEVFVETKRMTGPISNIQEFQIDKLNRCGAKAFTCYSWEEWIKIKQSVGLNSYVII